MTGLPEHALSASHRRAPGGLPDLAADPVDVAPGLLGALLYRRTPEGVIGLRITEVEAYGGQDDPGSHARRGPTPRNATMFGPPGCAYVYFTYGMHFCLNIVAHRVGQAGAVLVRAGEVVGGVELAAVRRPGSRPRDLARGPARLTRALAIDRGLDGVALSEAAGQVWLAAGQPLSPAAVVCGPRVGVAGDGGQRPWRFYLAGEPTVSLYRPGGRRRRR